MSVHRTKIYAGLITVVVVNVALATALYVVIRDHKASAPSANPDEALNYTPVEVAAAQRSTSEAMLVQTVDYLPGPATPEDNNWSPQPLQVASANEHTVQQPTLVADIAVEADYEYFANSFRGNMIRAQNYVTELLTAVSAIYERDIHVRLRPTFVRIATQPNDPWSTVKISDALIEVKSYWTVNEPGQRRAAVLFLSGKNLGGGLAYRSGLCTNEFGYAVVGSIKGSFTTESSNNTWDLVSVAHELGHVFGSKHSHCYKRGGEQAGWYDQCYGAQAASECYSGPVHPSNGTIMSYCYVAGGSMSRINPISFSDGDPAMTSVMRQTAEGALTGNGSGCLNDAPEAMPAAANK